MFGNNNNNNKMKTEQTPHAVTATTEKKVRLKMQRKQIKEIGGKAKMK